MTTYEKLIQKRNDCYTAARNCFDNGKDDMAKSWCIMAKAIELNANQITIGECQDEYTGIIAKMRVEATIGTCYQNDSGTYRRI